MAPIRVGVNPVAIAISPDGTLAYVIEPRKLDGNANRSSHKPRTPRIEAAGRPSGVAFTRDGRDRASLLARQLVPR